MNLTPPIEPLTGAPPIPGSAARPESRLPKGMLAGLALVGLFLNGFLWVPMTACMCGHYGVMTAVVLVPSYLALACLGVSGWFQPWLERLINYTVLVLLTPLVTKTVMDILWYGHNAWLR